MLSKYELRQKISSGSFGQVFSAVNKRTGERVAIKVEKLSELSSLKHEARVYNILKNLPGIPSIKWFGTDEQNSYIILPLFKYNLKELRCSRTLQDSEIISIGKQILSILEHIHKMSVVHCDIKPDNFMIERGSTTLFLIDFGFARKFNPNSKIMNNSVGTPNFMSRSVHSKKEPGFLDDIESSLYVLLSLYKNGLSWTSTWTSRETNVGDILKQKQGLFDTSNSIPHFLLKMTNYIINEQRRSGILDYNLV